MVLLQKLCLSLFCSMVFAAGLLAQDTATVTSPVSPLFKDSSSVWLNTDSTKVVTSKKDSSTVKPKHDPRKATLRSALIPGWGQAYNREYWKIPIVYGALAIPASLYIYNNNYYKRTKFAYSAVYAATVQTPADPTQLLRIDPKVMQIDPATGQLIPLNLATYQSYRNQFKRDKDYSLLWFFVVWALNVADATVFGHLKDFDVSDDLSMHMEVQPTFIPELRSAGLGFAVNVKKPARKLLPLPTHY